MFEIWFFFSFAPKIFYDRTNNFTPYFSESTCTFPSELEGDWYSAYKGKLTFNSTHVTGYPIYMSAAVQSLDFECYINEGRKYLLRYMHVAVWKTRVNLSCIYLFHNMSSLKPYAYIWKIYMYIDIAPRLKYVLYGCA